MRKPPAAAVRPGHRGGRRQPRRPRRVHPGQRRRPDPPAASGEALRGRDPARGGELFRLNCASCHNFTGRGGALSSGKFAPSLDPATETQIYTAMLSGPQNMPKFSDRQLTPEEKQDIIAYIKSVRGRQQQPRRQRRSAASGRCPRADRLHRRSGRPDRVRAVAGSEVMTTSEQHHGPRQPDRGRAREHDARTSWPGWPRSSTTSTSSTTSASGRSPAPGPRSAPSARSPLWFAISALSGLAFIAAFLFWPYEYRSPVEAGLRDLRGSTRRSSGSRSGSRCSRWASASSPTSRSSSPTRCRSSSATTARPTRSPARP